jgi:hypothetical protein
MEHRLLYSVHVSPLMVLAKTSRVRSANVVGELKCGRLHGGADRVRISRGHALLGGTGTSPGCSGIGVASSFASSGSDTARVMCGNLDTVAAEGEEEVDDGDGAWIRDRRPAAASLISTCLVGMSELPGSEEENAAAAV